MRNIRTTNVRRLEADTPDEVAKIFNDVYSHLRALRDEIENLRDEKPKAPPVVPVPVPTEPEPTKATRKIKESRA